MKWTKELPKEDGIYFYHDDGEVSVVEFDLDSGWIFFLGDYVPWGEDLFSKIEGEFWTDPVQFPPVP